MESQILNTIFYSFIAGLATLVGVYMVFAKEKWAARNTIFFLSFSAGVILATAFTHILPEAIELNKGGALTVVLFTLIGYYIFEHLIAIHTCRERGDDCEVHSMGLPAFVAIGLHSLLDGVVIGVGFEADIKVGIASAVAILLHRLPVGITVASLLMHSGFSKTKVLLMGWVVAVAAGVGALGAYFFVRDVSMSTLGLLLAFSAGSFIYIGASDLLPETHKKMSRFNILLVLVGVILVYIVSHTTGGH